MCGPRRPAVGEGGPRRPVHPANCPKKRRRCRDLLARRPLPPDSHINWIRAGGVGGVAVAAVRGGPGCGPGCAVGAPGRGNATTQGCWRLARRMKGPRGVGPLGKNPRESGHCDCVLLREPRGCVTARGTRAQDPHGRAGLARRPLPALDRPLPRGTPAHRPATASQPEQQVPGASQPGHLRARCDGTHRVSQMARARKVSTILLSDRPQVRSRAPGRPDVWTSLGKRRIGDDDRAWRRRHSRCAARAGSPSMRGSSAAATMVNRRPDLPIVDVLITGDQAGLLASRRPGGGAPAGGCGERLRRAGRGDTGGRSDRRS
jgi:hypothetical protein